VNLTPKMFKAWFVFVAVLAVLGLIASVYTNYIIYQDCRDSGLSRGACFLIMDSRQRNQEPERRVFP
jgi:hypothetical protein